MKPFTPHPKKPVKLKIKTKLVKIDSKTTIEVSISLTDEEARERYCERHREKQSHPRIYQTPMTIKEALAAGYEGPD